MLWIREVLSDPVAFKMFVSALPVAMGVVAAQLFVPRLARRAGLFEGALVTMLGAGLVVTSVYLNIGFAVIARSSPTAEAFLHVVPESFKPLALAVGVVVVLAVIRSFAVLRSRHLAVSDESAQTVRVLSALGAGAAALSGATIIMWVVRLAQALEPGAVLANPQRYAATLTQLNGTSIVSAFAGWLLGLAMIGTGVRAALRARRTHGT